HELTMSDVYRDKTDPSVYVRLPLKERPGESLVVWTTTPWTLPAHGAPATAPPWPLPPNVPAPVKPDAEYVLRENGDWVARERYPNEVAVRAVKGEDLVGLSYDGAVDDLPRVSGTEPRVRP